jgi:hypothetical protein
MRRFLLLTTTLLLTIALLYSPRVRTQEPEKALPNPVDYPAAGANCKRRVKLSPWVGTPGVDWPKTFQCVLSIHTCDGVKTYKSGVRAAGAGMCADYWAAHGALTNREVCCDAPTQNKLPRPADYPAARQDCKNKERLIVDPVRRVEVAPGNRTIKCQFSTRVCGVTKQYESEERENTPNACVDYEAAATALLGLLVCCDSPEERPPCEKYSGEITCDCNADGRDETRKEFESCGIPGLWPTRFRSRCEDWVRMDGTLGYATDVGIQRQGSAYLEFTLKCPALECDRKFKPCEQEANEEYEKCTFSGVRRVRVDCFAQQEAALKKCRQNRDRCLKQINKGGPDPNPQPLPTPTPPATGPILFTSLKF